MITGKIFVSAKLTKEMYKKVAIFGAGASGRSAQALAMGLGMEVCLFDEAGKGYAAEFDKEYLENFDAFVFSPGFAASHPWRLIVEGSSSPCYGELGFAAWHWRGPILGITGTNGKTSLTSLISNALKASGAHAIKAGNIGLPLSDFILSSANTDQTYAVCEISSFQAELTRGLQLDGFFWTNFEEDHLDRYASREEYFAAKRRLIGCLKAGAPAFLGAGVPTFDPSVSNASNTLVVSGDSRHLAKLAAGSPFCRSPQSSNFALAAAFWEHSNLPMRPLVESANNFKLAPHRLSLVSEWCGVQFWNDSKATNFHAALSALSATERNIYWITGGSGKGGDLESFVQKAAPKVRKAFLYGSVSEKMAGCFHATAALFEQQIDFFKAVKAATEAALMDERPAAVLLSPGFASFDQFSGYAARGEAFIAAISKLKDNYCTD